jgi:hypothetical protein
VAPATPSGLLVDVGGTDPNDTLASASTAILSKSSCSSQPSVGLKEQLAFEISLFLLLVQKLVFQGHCCGQGGESTVTSTFQWDLPVHQMYTKRKCQNYSLT